MDTTFVPYHPATTSTQSSRVPAKHPLSVLSSLAGSAPKSDLATGSPRATHRTEQADRTRSARQPTIDLIEGQPWSAVRDHLARQILDRATPRRPDRLFPAGHDQGAQPEAGTSLAHGAAGVLWTLAEIGAPTPPEHVDWLARTAARGEPRPGLFDGAHGVAYALDRLGRRDEALRLLRRIPVESPPTGSMDCGLYRGAAGIGLTLLHFAGVTGDASLRLAAHELAEDAYQQLFAPAARRVAPGLMHGWSGLALLLLRLYEASGDTATLDRAELALRRDLDRCAWLPDGTLHIDGRTRTPASLTTGGTGIGLVLHELSGSRTARAADTSAQRAIRRSARIDRTIHNGLFHGRAGLLAYLSTVEPSAVTREATADLIDATFSARGAAATSTDLANGTAGVLLALGQALADRPVRLPMLTSLG